MKYLLMIIMMPWTFASASIGFENGHSMVVEPMLGEAHFRCYDHHGINIPRTVRCYAENIDPYRTDHFFADVDFEVKRLHLKSQWEDGNIEKKSKRFNNEKGRTRTRVNLWIDTLFQEPLLGPGTNLVEYHLEGEDQSLKGQIEFHVDLKPRKYCEPLSLGFRYQCRTDDHRACNDYFRYEPRCE